MIELETRHKLLSWSQGGSFPGTSYVKILFLNCCISTWNTSNVLYEIWFEFHVLFMQLSFEGLQKLLCISLQTIPISLVSGKKWIVHHMQLSYENIISTKLATQIIIDLLNVICADESGFHFMQKAINCHKLEYMSAAALSWSFSAHQRMHHFVCIYKSEDQSDGVY